MTIRYLIDSLRVAAHHRLYDAHDAGIRSSAWSRGYHRGFADGYEKARNLTEAQHAKAILEQARRDGRL